MFIYSIRGKRTGSTAQEVPPGLRNLPLVQLLVTVAHMAYIVYSEHGWIINVNDPVKVYSEDGIDLGHVLDTGNSVVNAWIRDQNGSAVHQDR